MFPPSENKWVVGWIKLLLHMHRLCLYVSDSVRMKGSARNPTCLYPVASSPMQETVGLAGSLFPAQPPPAYLPQSPWKSLSWELWVKKRCLSQAELIPEASKCVSVGRVWGRGKGCGEEILKQPDLVDIGQQYLRTFFGVEVWLSFF